MITDSADVGLPDRCPAADRRPPDAAGPIEALLAEVWLEAAKLDSGELATYIPQLAHADPRAFGIALATLDGRVYSAGELVPFTIQSVSKPFVYALALADCGLEAVLDRVGVEPTGNAFNTISVDNRGRPFNPMVNAGAIATTALVAGEDASAQFQRIHDGLSAFAGRPLDRPLDIDERVLNPSSRQAIATARSRSCSGPSVHSPMTSTGSLRPTSGSVRCSSLLRTWRLWPRPSLTAASTRSRVTRWSRQPSSAGC